MDIIYAMPNQPNRLFVNVVHACPNACVFCVDFLGDNFYGFNLKGGRALTADAIVDAVRAYKGMQTLTELYFCGIGEPLLAYDTVVSAARRLRSVVPDVLLAVNTSGTHFRFTKRLDFAQEFDLIQISLNAESEKKYDEICRPKLKGTFNVVIGFLNALRRHIDEHSLEVRVELSVVDISKAEPIPHSEQTTIHHAAPDIGKCRDIAENFGWPLKVKQLMPAPAEDAWTGFAESFRQHNRTRQHVDARLQFQSTGAFDFSGSEAVYRTIRLNKIRATR